MIKPTSHNVSTRNYEVLPSLGLFMDENGQPNGLFLAAKVANVYLAD